MKNRHFTILILLISLSAGCAHVEHPDPDDPYESFNRTMFEVNRQLDTNLIKPLAKAYNKVVPPKAQLHIGYFFNNIALLPTVANDILQANLTQALADGTRFGINTTIGLLGFFDAAAHLKMNLPPNKQDLGLTLAKYGVDESPFVMLPLFGPKTLRDVSAMPTSMSLLSPFGYVDSPAVGYSTQTINILNIRASLMPVDKLIDEAFDPYIFVRNAYLQTRNKAVSEVALHPPSSTSANIDEEESFDEELEDEEDDFLESLEDEDFLLSYKNDYQQHHLSHQYHRHHKG
jgi:phospholipid-binding lipoprotein MlaA